MPSRGLLPLADGRRGFKPVHIGHLHVQEKHVEGLRLQGSQSVTATGHGQHRVSALREQPVHQGAVDGAVLGEQDPETAPPLP